MVSMHHLRAHGVAFWRHPVLGAALMQVLTAKRGMGHEFGVRDDMRASRLLGPWKPPVFLLSAVMIILLSRGAVILTSHDDAQMDLSIYQEVGELVANGIDPYDFANDRQRREALRLNDYGAAAWAKQNSALYDYYVSSNLPGSTVLYGWLERISSGNPKVFRLAFAFGDVLIAVAAYVLLTRCGIVLDTFGKQATFSLAAIYYPSNIEWGLVWSEDKQIQTALMLFAAGLLVIRPAGRGRLNALAIGSVGAMSIIFKAFGIFLAPLALSYFHKAPRRELLLALFAAVVTALPFLLYFDLSFIRLAFDRLAHGVASSTTALHGSPWQLVPFAAASCARPLLCAALAILAALAFARGRLDALNFSAAIGVIVACLWMVGGSMDRMNIAMMFAMFCAATLSIGSWQSFVLLNFIVQLLIYATTIARTSWLHFFDGETPDAIATAIFVTSYVGLLLKECLGDRSNRMIALQATVGPE